ncbi:MAG TPA: caspase family protein [Pyrinomonadaceae bacterium]|nr:caspase family protein [Pyrinomonadaceae bacterium]
MSNTLKSFFLRVLDVSRIALSLTLALCAGALSPSAAQTNPPTGKDAKPELVLQTGYNTFFGATRLVFSPDARLLATTTWRSGTIKLWDTATGRELRNLSLGGPTGMTISPLLTFSSDGRWLASATTSAVKVWDVISGRELQTLSAGQASMASAFGFSFVGFSADGKKLVALSDAIRVWDTSSWSLLKTIDAASLNPAAASGLRGVAVGPDGNQIAFTYLNGDKTDVRLFDLTSGAETRSIKLDHQEGTLELSFTTDGRLLAAGIVEKKLKLWDLNGKNQRDLGPTVNDYSVIAFSRDGRVVSLSEGYVVKLWDTVAGRELPPLNVPNNGVFPDRGAVFVGLNADGKKAATGGFGTKTFLWDTDTGRQIQEFKGRSNWAYSVAFSPDGHELSVGGRTRWDLRNGRGLRLLPSPSDKLFAMPSRDGKLVATFSPTSNTITVLEAITGRTLQTLVSSAKGGIERARFSPDGKLIAAFSSPGGTPTLASINSNEVKIWETSSGRQVQSLNVGLAPSDVAFSDDGQWLITFQGQGEVAMWSVASGSKARTLKSSPMANMGNLANMRNPGQMPNMADLNNMVNDMLGSVAAGTMGRSVTSVAFNPDGRIVATAGTESKSNLDLNAIMNNSRNQKPSRKNQDPNDYMKDIKIEVTGQVVFWDATTGAEAGAIKGHGKGITSVVFSRDGKRLATGSTDNTIKIWDMSSKSDLRTLTGHTSNIESMDFSPDGKLLASASDDGSTILWDAETGEQLLTLISLDDGGEWMVVTPQGLFDGTPQSWNQILWRYGNDTFNVSPVELYFNEFYHPGLLSDIFAGKRPKPAQDITKRDRRQPTLKLTSTGDASARLLKVTVEVAEAAADSAHTSGSGAQDVRLFRNGSLVKVWRGDVLKGQRNVTLEATIPIVAGENKLTAYAFNHENIKSSDAELIVKGADSLKRQGTAYVLAVGVNNYANANYNLKYAVADAEDFAAEVKRQQEALKRYATVEILPLANDQATKANFTQKLTELAKRVQPEDAVIVFFAGHGTAQGNQFYLIPHDLGYDGPRESLNESGLQTILAHSVSDRELEKLFEGIDASQLLLVIDACNSGQALEAEEKRRGPMNSKGLAQLAYEKGMYVMTAAQSYQAAQEAARFGHGFLTYALVEEGLKQGAADREPKNGAIEMREWLDFATDEVPRMQLNNSREALRGGGRYVNFVGDGRELGIPKTEEGTSDNIQRPRVFYRRELEASPLVIATVGVASPR